MEEQRTNPFLRALGQAATTVAAMPVRAVKLPFQLLGEALNLDAGADAAQRQQQQLAERVTGQAVPYSEGRAYANALSLGLIPGNKPMNVDPNTLNSEQQQRFQQLNPLQQALLQAKNPRDFAELLQRDEFFAERQPEKVIKLGATERLVDPSTNEVLVQPDRGMLNVPQGGSVFDPNTREQVFTNTPPPKVMSDYEAARIRQYDEELARKGRETDKRLEKYDAEIRKLNAEADGEGGSDLPIADRSKIQTMESRVAGQVGKATKDLSRGAVAWRNIRQLGEIRGDTVPPALVSELEQYGFADPEVGVPLRNRRPGSVRNLLLLTNVVRLSDPPGRITDKDVDMYSRARAYLSPGLVESAMRGEVWTPTQEAEAISAAARLSSGLLETHDAAVLDGRKQALRDRLAGRGVGMAPQNAAPDGMRDIRLDLVGPALPDPTQAAYPIADAEAEDMLRQLWEMTKPNEQPTKESFTEFANMLGFGIAGEGAGGAADPDTIDQVYSDFVQSGGKPDDEAAFRAYAEKLGVALP